MKRLSNKSLMSILYGLLLALPMFAVLSRVLYVQLNKNAYQSYSGSNGYDLQYKYETNEVNNADDLIPNRIYNFTLTENSTQLTTWFKASRIICEDLLIDVDLSINATNNSYLTLVQSSSTNNLLIQLDGNTTLNTITPSQYSYPVVFNVVYKSDGVDYTKFSESSYNEIIGVEITNNGTLDNVFEYSLDETIKDDNFGQIDFTSWFSHFLLGENAVNNRYINYFNWYLNYAMFVSGTYVLFLCMMWFVNFARRLLDRGMNYDW